MRRDIAVATYPGTAAWLLSLIGVTPPIRFLIVGALEGFGYGMAEDEGVQIFSNFRELGFGTIGDPANEGGRTSTQ